MRIPAAEMSPQMIIFSIEAPFDDNRKGLHIKALSPLMSIAEPWSTLVEFFLSGPYPSMGEITPGRF